MPDPQGTYRGRVGRRGLTRTRVRILHETVAETSLQSGCDHNLLLAPDRVPRYTCCTGIGAHTLPRPAHVPIDRHAQQGVRLLRLIHYA